MKRIVLAILLVSLGLSVTAAIYVPSTTTVTRPYVYLTFDDGPTPGYTNEVLADLNTAGAHATFFQVGEHMAGNEALMRKLVADGNQLGTHSWDHPDFGNIANNGAAVWEEIQRPRYTQIAITGLDSRLFRYPHFQAINYGGQVLTYLGMKAVGADIQTADWNPMVTDTAIVKQAMTGLHSGSIIDLHDGFTSTLRDGGHPGYLPTLLARLTAAGYTTRILTSETVPTNTTIPTLGG